MKEVIGVTIYSICKEYAQTYLSEAETESYPYIVYTSAVEELTTKDGVYAITSDLSIDIYADEHDKADDISVLIKEDINKLRGAIFAPTFLRKTSICQSGIWIISLDFTIKQKK